MDLVNFFGDYICKTFEYKQCKIKLIDFDNIDNNKNYLYFVSHKVMSRNHSNIDVDINEVLTKIKISLPVYILEFEKDFCLNSMKSFIILEQINNDLLSVNHLSDDFMKTLTKTSSDYIRYPFDIDNNVPKNVLGSVFNYHCCFTKEFKIFNRGIAHLYNQDNFFGISKSPMIEFEYSIIDKNIDTFLPVSTSGLNIVFRMYDNKNIFYESILPIEYYNNLPKGTNYKQYLNKFMVDFLLPFTTDLSVYEPLKFKKMTTKTYLKNFEKHIRTLKEMENI